MAHVLTPEILQDGLKNTDIKITITGDPTDATELVKAILFDASAYSNPEVKNKLMRISYTLNGFSAQLFWDATSDVPLMTLENDYGDDFDFSQAGGLINNAGTGITGDILISTTGLASTSNHGHIILHIVHRDIPFKV